MAQRYQLNHSHDGQSTTNPGLKTRLRLDELPPSQPRERQEHYEQRQPGPNPNLAPETLLSPWSHWLTLDASIRKTNRTQGTSSL